MINEPDIHKWYEKAIEFIADLENNQDKKTDLRKRQYNWAVEQTWDNRIPMWEKVLSSL